MRGIIILVLESGFQPLFITISYQKTYGTTKIESLSNIKSRTEWYQSRMIET